MNQRALARLHVNGSMKHLVRRDVVQHHADSLGGIQGCRQRNQFSFGQADIFGIGTMNRHRNNLLSKFDTTHTIAKAIHHPNQIPAGCVRRLRRFGMYAFSCHDIRHADAGGQYPNTRFANFRFRALFFNYSKHLWTTVLVNNNACVSHRRFPLLFCYPNCLVSIEVG